MSKKLSLLALCAAALLAGLLLTRPAASAGGLSVSLQTHATGLSNAIGLAHHGADRIFVNEIDGRIRIIEPDGSLIGTPFLDIDSRVLSAGETGAGSEQGLLGLAFHPDYETNGFFYVYYTRDGAAAEDGDLVISRFSVTADPNVADPNSELILLVIEHSGATNHNGGNLEFGPDGFLYIGAGDGGGGGDPNDNGQRLTTLLGKLLRIDVNLGGGGAVPPDNCSISGANYEVPTSNPFDDGAGGSCDEIWAWGLRNPWRWAFDPLNGDLFIGDVGQNSWEEIDYQPGSSAGGENYGWDCYEGVNPYADPSPSVPCGPAGDYVFPIQVYSSSGSHCSVTGGEIYRGTIYPELYGQYIYADYCSGNFWALFDSGGGNWTNTSLGDLGSSITAFGTRADGELFVTNGSTVYHIVEDTQSTATHTPTATSTPRPTRTPTGIPPTATASPTPGGNQAHVGDLDGTSVPNGALRWNATVEITVLDQNGAPVSGATVNGAWSAGATGTGSCVTNASGKCSITKTMIRNTSLTVTFTVTNVSAAGYAYNPGANTDPDGDSNGTVIIVNKP